jgi:hypothetical protein
MKIEYCDLEDTNHPDDAIIRIFSFNSTEVSKLIDELSKFIDSKKILDFSKLEFIERINCNLIFEIGNEDIGIISKDKWNYICKLKKDTFVEMIEKISPFIDKCKDGTFQFLYDLNNPIELVFSPNGTW